MQLQNSCVRLVSFLCVVSALSSCAAGSDQTCATADCGTGGDGPLPTKNYVGAAGVAIQEVAIYQSLKRTLVKGGGAVAPTPQAPPLVAGRDAVIRVFYQLDANYNGQPVNAVLSIEGQNPVTVTATLSGSSVEENYASTVNFFVPGASIGSNFAYTVSLGQEGTPANDHPPARWPATGLATLSLETPANVLRITLVPYQYNADGSARVSNTEPATVERYRQRFKQLYPVSDVQITLHAPVPYPSTISPTGSGWTQVLDHLTGLRQQESPSNDVYYYGIFDPAPTEGQFCGGGCVSGLAPINPGPSGDPSFRVGVGLGYVASSGAFVTAAHELGHAHGREHAPCGGADNVDPQFPHPTGRIGIWGLDVATQTLVPPTRSDIMGYCDDPWISDYNYAALAARSKGANLPKIQGDIESQFEVILVDESGNGAFRRTVTATPASMLASGSPLAVVATDARGHKSPVEARFIRFDHLPGGWLIVPTGDKRPNQVEFEINGAAVMAKR